MFKLCLVSFYGVKEYILSLKNCFEDKLYTVFNYPLFQYAYDENDKIEDYCTHFIKYQEKIKPDILMESSSHTDEAIEDAREVMESIGGKVIVIPYYPSQSSTSIKEKINGKNKTK